MRVAYIILTCEKYLDTRIIWQRQTSLAHVPSEDIFYLGHTMNEEQRLFSWGAADNYESLPYKYYDFFRNTALTYDWYVLMDDDTYVYPDRLAAVLSTYDPSTKMCIGKTLNHVKDELWSYPSGGAGTAISNALYEALCHHVRTASPSTTLVHWCADICVGKWVKDQTEVICVDHPQFHTDPYHPLQDDAAKAITFHHLRTHQEYLLCAHLEQSRA